MEDIARWLRDRKREPEVTITPLMPGEIALSGGFRTDFSKVRPGATLEDHTLEDQAWIEPGTDIAALDDEAIVKFLPYRSARSIYRIRRQEGLGKVEALAYCLRLCLPQELREGIE